MTLPLFNRNVGFNVQPLTIPVEPLAPGKEFRAGVETAKSLPTTELAVAQGIKGAVETYNKIAQDQADIEGKQISNRQEAIKLQSMEQLAPEALEAARLKLEQQRDDYARELQIQKREDEFVNIMRNGSDSQKVEAFWSGRYVDVFAKNKGMQEAVFETIIKQRMTPEQLQHQLGKSTDNYLAKQAQKWTLNKALAEQDAAFKADDELHKTPAYTSILNDKTTGLATEGQVQAAITQAELLPFNSVQADENGNVIRDPNTKQVLRQNPDGATLPMGFGDKDKNRYSTIVVGNKVKHVLTDDFEKVRQNINTVTRKTQRSRGLEASDPDSSMMQLLENTVAQEIGAKKTTPTQPTQPPQQDMQQSQAQPPQQQDSQEAVIKRQQEAEKDTISATAMSRAGYIQGNTIPPEKKEAFKSYVGKKLELTPEETAKYGDELVKAVEIQLLVPESQLTSFMGQAYDAKYTPGKLYNLANEIAIKRSKEAENKKTIETLELSMQRKDAVEKASKLAGVKIGDEKYTSNKVTPTPMYQSMRNIGATRTDILNKLYLIMKEAEKVRTLTSKQAVDNGQGMGNVNAVVDQLDGVIQ